MVNISVLYFIILCEVVVSSDVPPVLAVLYVHTGFYTSPEPYVLSHHSLKKQRTDYILYYCRIHSSLIIAPPY